jgi:hypothetical protein
VKRTLTAQITAEHTVTGKSTAVLGIYCSLLEARLAIDALICAGFAGSDIAVLRAAGGSLKEFTGATLLTVHCDTAQQISRAMEMLEGTDAEDIASISASILPRERATVLS